MITSLILGVLLGWTICLGAICLYLVLKTQRYTGQKYRPSVAKTLGMMLRGTPIPIIMEAAKELEDLPELTKKLEPDVLSCLELTHFLGKDEIKTGKDLIEKLKKSMV
jgi:hypothetical protein